MGAPPSVDKPKEILSSPVIFEKEKTYTFLADLAEEAIATFGWTLFLPSKETLNMKHTGIEVSSNIISTPKTGTQQLKYMLR